MKHGYLVRIEEELSLLSPSARSLIHIAVASSILAAGWTYWVSPLLESTKTLQNDIYTMQSSINRIDLHLYDSQIAQKKKKIMSLKEAFTYKKSVNRFIEKELKKKKFSFLRYKESDFIYLLKSILKYSEEFGLKIDEIFTPVPGEEDEKNAAVQLAQKLSVSVPVLQLTKRVIIEGSGSYESILNLLYRIESEHNLMYVKDLDMRYDEKEKNLRFSIELNHYGVSL